MNVLELVFPKASIISLGHYIRDFVILPDIDAVFSTFGDLNDHFIVKCPSLSLKLDEGIHEDVSIERLLEFVVISLLRSDIPESKHNCLTLNYELPMIPPKALPLSECYFKPSLIPGKRNNFVNRFKTRKWRNLFSIIGPNAFFELMANFFIFTTSPPSCMVQLGGPLLTYVVRSTARDRMMKRRCYIRSALDLRKWRQLVPGAKRKREEDNEKEGNEVENVVKHRLAEMVDEIVQELDYETSFSVSFGSGFFSSPISKFILTYSLGLLLSQGTVNTQSQKNEKGNRVLTTTAKYGDFQKVFRSHSDELELTRRHLFYSRNVSLGKSFFKMFQRIKGSNGKSHRDMFCHIFLRNDNTEPCNSATLYKDNRLCKRLYDKLRKSFKHFTKNFKESKVKPLLDQCCPLPDLMRICNKSQRRKNRNNRPSMIYLLKSKSPSENVIEFVRRVLLLLFPVGSVDGDIWFGTRSNRHRVVRWVRKQVASGRYWSTKLSVVLDNLDLSQIPWLHGWERWQRRLLFGRFITWILSELVVGLVKGYFYVTDSAYLRNRTLFYRKPIWNSLYDQQLSKMVKSKQLVRVPSDQEVKKRVIKYCFTVFVSTFVKLSFRKLTSGNAFLATLRFLPKETGLRPVLAMGRKVKLTNLSGSSVYASAPNHSCENALQHLLYIRRTRPEVMGASILSRSEFTARWKLFIEHNSKTPKPIYFVRLDISKCFDNIDRPLLSNIFLNKTLVAEANDVLIRKLSVIRIVGNVLRVQDRWCTSEVTGAANSLSESCKMFQNELGIRSAIIVDTDNLARSTSEELKTVFCKSVAGTYVRTGHANNNFHYLNKGIAQGSLLSPLLCNIYYAALERKYIDPLLDKNEDFFVRQTDDFLLATPSLDRARDFLTLFFRGFGKFEVIVNFEKLETNLPPHTLKSLERKFKNILKETRSKSLNSATVMSFCGLSLDTESLSVGIDWNRYISLLVSDTMTFTLLRDPLQTMVRKLCSSLFSFGLPLALDCNLHSFSFVKMEVTHFCQPRKFQLKFPFLRFTEYFCSWLVDFILC